MKLSRAVLLLTLSLVAIGCVKIPEAYFGNYADSQYGATLVLGQNKAEFVVNGRRYKASGKDLTFDDLNQMKAGIYDTEDKSSGMIEVYWVNPVPGTRQEQAGFVWFSSEVLYTYFAAKQSTQVQELQLVQCTQGIVMLDTETQRIQVGCPEGSTTYNLVRTR